MAKPIPSFSINEKLSVIKISIVAGVVISIIKFLAYYFTQSTAILSDALESLINIAASVFALFSLQYASKYKDRDHPYGHGKIEFISAGFEGGLITMAGIWILYEGIYHLIHEPSISNLKIGIVLSSFSGITILLISLFISKKAKLHNSLIIKAEGKHLFVDAITSIGLVVGLIIIYFTQLVIIDSLLAICYSAYIIYMGIKLFKEAIDGLLDKADYHTINQIIETFNTHRQANWIDVHNLRLQKFGHLLHVDCHITLPYYYTLTETHNELENLDNLMNKEFNNQIEFFIHPDPCKPTACHLCSIQACPYRSSSFVKTIPWQLENIILNQAHN